MAHCFRRLIAALFFIAFAAAAEDSLTLASTTSTEQSGLFAFILPQFEAATGIKIKVVAVGSGQALDIARRGDADVLLVHDPAAEEKFMAEGFGSERRAVMHNDFVLVGPPALHLSQPSQALACLREIGKSGRAFVSRGDKSGTHMAELRLWQAAGVEPKKDLPAYKEAGAGMGQTLNMASAMSAATLADRGTWAAFKNRGELVILCQGDPLLFNPYSVIPVSEKRHPHVNARAARRFADWLTAANAGQAAIATFRINNEPVFFPDAR